MDYYGFYTGKILNAYEYLGCHIIKDKAVFRTFAPAAIKISVIGDFNNWAEEPMQKVYDGNFWECTIADVKEGMKYKYRIYKYDGSFTDHSDPYAFATEKPPGAASVIQGLNNYSWNDSKWLKKRNDRKKAAVNIYEVHLGSWRKKADDTWLSYSEIAEKLISYVKKKGYNYIELMPIAEHPCDNSWGYQQTGYYSPTARYGTPDELKYFIDYAHQNEIGVILDFVPVHFAIDKYSLAEYDGTALYEYPNIDVGISEWGSKNFNHSRGEVQSFLQSSAYYWIKEFHFDGLRIDALSNIIYWHGNKDRGVNERAVEFIKYMNCSIKTLYPDIMLIAEDSTAFEGVTSPVRDNGLGFDYKWDMGWMNDTLAYLKMPACERMKNYHKLTFSMSYYKNERFILPLSHDEVVHGKKTVLDKMCGEYEEKFSQARLLYMYMYTHPGKKLNFMGNELAQLREWDEKREQDWQLLKYPLHSLFSVYINDLCVIYSSNPALYEKDYENDGFKWIDCHQEEKCLYVFERKSVKQRLITVMNFSDTKQTYHFNSDTAEYLELIIASDDKKYGGLEDYSNKKSIAVSGNGFDVTLNPFSGMLFHAF